MTHIIRTSDRGLFKRCRREWDYSSKIRNFYIPVVQNRNLEFGTAFHRGMETYYDVEKWNFLSNAMKTALAIDSFQQELDRQKKAMGDNLDMVLEQQIEEERTTGSKMLTYYGAWSLEQYEVTPVEVELEFEVPVLVPQGVSKYALPDGFTARPSTRELFYQGDPVVYQGRIDLIAIIDGEYWIIDFKTANRLEETNPHLDVDSQITSYAWAARTFFGYDIAGVIYQQHRKAYPQPPRVLSTGKLSKDKSQPTTVALYEQSIVEQGLVYSDYAEFLSWLKDNEPQYVRRIEQHRSKQELDSQGEYIYNEALDMLGSPRIYPNPAYFTCKYCLYKAPCMMDNDGGDGLQYLELSSEFEIGER